MKKGISLIVLSITILVMAIIAATVIISLEDSGIIGRAKNTTKKSNYADEYTRLTIIKNGILTDNLGEITVEEYINELDNQGILESGRMNNADGSVTVTTKSGYEVTISQSSSSDLTMEFAGFDDSNNGNNSNNQNGNQNDTKVMITFEVCTISYQASYQAEEGMTWSEWCASQYNGGEFEIVGNSICYYSNRLLTLTDYGDDYIMNTDVIIPNYQYGLSASGGVGN